MGIKKRPTSAEINSLFANNNPDEVWGKALSIIFRINPGYDAAIARAVFDDVMRLFQGEYPGYCPIKTLYHDLNHTLDVFLCAVRLLHGLHVSGVAVADDEITLIMIATLMHDIGYVQLQGEENGTGAQFTQSHVRRGIDFMRHYVAEKRLPPGFAEALAPLMLSTDAALNIAQLDIPDERTRLLAKVVATADLTGQMADRSYLEKLLFLYLEFEEAHIGNFQNALDMLRRTGDFYKQTRIKLDKELDGIYTKLSFHFKDTFSVENNYYLESIEKNIDYLSKVISLNEAECLAMLKRGGIVEKSKTGGLAEVICKG